MTRTALLTILYTTACFAATKPIDAGSSESSGSSGSTDPSASSTTSTSSESSESSDGEVSESAGNACAAEGEWCHGTESVCCAGLACVDWTGEQMCAVLPSGDESDSGGESSTTATATDEGTSGSTGDTPSNCCVEHARPGCDDAMIQQAVCAQYAECCLYNWAAICVMQAENAALC